MRLSTFISLFGMAIVFVTTADAAETGDIDCTAQLIDRASVLEQPDRARIETASQPLVNEGADVHVVTTELAGHPTLDAAVRAFIHSCPSWQSPDGAPKNTLLILAMAPIARKSGIFYGAGWAHALDDHWTKIMADEMNPRFREHDFAGGFIAAEQHLSRHIRISEEESQHGTTVINQQQAVDLMASWTFLKWVLLFGILCLGLSFFFVTCERKRKDKERLQAARQDAVLACKQAGEQLTSVRAKFVQYDAVGGEKRAETRVIIDDAAETYARLTRSTAMDPEQPGLSAFEYAKIAEEFRAISRRAKQASAVMDGVDPNGTHPLDIGSHWKRGYTEATSRHLDEPRRSGVQVRSAPGRNSSGDGFVSGLVVGSLLSHHDSTNSVWSGSESGSSSSNSWTSDSGSSSSDSSGGSSDWGSSGMDGGSSSW